MNSNWKAPKNSHLPDFIIAGAAKCGTTSLHNILNSHPDVFIPEGEPHFFDHDNFCHHQSNKFFDNNINSWNFMSMKNDKVKLWSWYSNKFKGNEHLITGDDSTGYFIDVNTPKRISIQDKAIKIIILLRNPTERCYSHYFQNLRTHKAIFSFEDYLKYDFDFLTKASLYKKNIERFLNFIPRERIKFIIFEDFISNTEYSMREISSFLNIDFSKFSDDAFNIHSNPSKLPRCIKMKYIFNRNFRQFGNWTNRIDKPFLYKSKQIKRSFFEKSVIRLNYFLNPTSVRKYPNMRRATKQFLDDYFIFKSKGLDEIIGKNVMNKWFK